MTTSSLDPDGFEALMQRYFEHERGQGYAEGTLRVQKGHLLAFFAWCAERDVTRPTELTRAVLERYPRWLFRYRRPKSDKPLSVDTIYKRISVLRGFFRFLTRERVLEHNPASELTLRRGRTSQLPKHVLSLREVEEVLSQPDITTQAGIRDRAMLETLYSTGIRRMELGKLSLLDLDKDRGYLLVREGKGKKDRVVPIGERALLWIDKYLADVRPLFAKDPDDGLLFLVPKGDRMSLNHVTDLVRGYVQAGVGKPGGCHLFRHTAATLMLEGGADIRFIQAMLGHEKLTTTQIYTKVAIHKLKEVHERTHPGAKVGRNRTAEDDAEGGC